MKSEKKSNTALMTKGVIWKQLLLFSFPLILGNLFQQLYNMVDSIVVGNFIGSHALAAVGAGTSIINVLIALFMGLTIGAGVVISQFFGAGKEDKLSETVQTAAVFTILFGFFMSLIGVFMADPILKWIHTPNSVFAQSSIYLRIFFSGILFLMIYNMGAAILRAVGDSKTPLYYLGAASIINIILDVLFVVVFHLGVLGVAIATLIAQGISAVLVIRKLVHSTESYQLNLKVLKIYPVRLKHILLLGIPTGLQQMVISLSNVIIQAYINKFGADAMAGWSVYGKLDGFLILPVLSFGLAMTTYTGQNIGAKKTDRIHQGVRVCMLMNCGLCIFLSLLFYFTGNMVFRIFTREPEVLDFCAAILHSMVPFYFLLAVIHVFSGTISGAGYSLSSMIIMTGNMCILRIFLIWILSSISNEVSIIFYAYILSWLGCALCFTVYYFKGKWRKVLKEF
ncbi:MAG: MATE family efflux transporter [Anaerovorax sp.]|nr:MATE family efflux transporter [Anaerovorax sp.]